MSNFNNLSQRVQEVQTRFQAKREQEREQKEQLQTLVEAIERDAEQFNSEREAMRCEITTLKHRIVELEEQNDQLQEMLAGLLAALEAGDEDDIGQALEELEQRVSAIAQERNGQQSVAPLAASAAMPDVEPDYAEEMQDIAAELSAMPLDEEPAELEMDSDPLDEDGFDEDGFDEDGLDALDAYLDEDAEADAETDDSALSLEDEMPEETPEPAAEQGAALDDTLEEDDEDAFEVESMMDEAPRAEDAGETEPADESLGLQDAQSLIKALARIDAGLEERLGAVGEGEAAESGYAAKVSEAKRKSEMDEELAQAAASGVRDILRRVQKRSQEVLNAEDAAMAEEDSLVTDVLVLDEADEIDEDETPRRAAS